MTIAISRPEDPRRRGELDLGDYWARWRGRAGDATTHKHLAAQAIFAPGGARLRLSDARHVPLRRWLCEARKQTGLAGRGLVWRSPLRFANHQDRDEATKP